VPTEAPTTRRLGFPSGSKAFPAAWASSGYLAYGAASPSYYAKKLAVN
jgi:hypothetical protein